MKYRKGFHGPECPFMEGGPCTCEREPADAPDPDTVERWTGRMLYEAWCISSETGEARYWPRMDPAMKANWERLARQVVPAAALERAEVERDETEKSREGWQQIAESKQVLFAEAERDLERAEARNAEDGWVRLPNDDYKNGLPEAFYTYAPLSLRTDPDWDDYHAGARDMLAVLRKLSTERSDDE